MSRPRLFSPFFFQYLHQIQAVFIMHHIPGEEPYLPGVDIAEAALEYTQIKQKDYFNSTVGQAVRQRLLAARGGEL